jgi:hypothetical protein
MLESYLVAVGVIPKLCGQSIMEHIVGSSYIAPTGQSCSDRSNRYNAMATSIVTFITGSVWYKSSSFTKANLSKNYNKIHRQVKKTLFGPLDTPSPSPSPLPIVQVVTKAAASIPLASASAAVKKVAVPVTSKKQKEQSPPRFNSREEEDEYYERQQQYEQGRR